GGRGGAAGGAGGRRSRRAKSARPCFPCWPLGLSGIGLALGPSIDRDGVTSDHPCASLLAGASCQGVPPASSDGARPPPRWPGDASLLRHPASGRAAERPGVCPLLCVPDSCPRSVDASRVGSSRSAPRAALPPSRFLAPRPRVVLSAS